MYAVVVFVTVTIVVEAVGVSKIVILDGVVIVVGGVAQVFIVLVKQARNGLELVE